MIDALVLESQAQCNLDALDHLWDIGTGTLLAIPSDPKLNISIPQFREMWWASPLTDQWIVSLKQYAQNVILEKLITWKLDSSSPLKEIPNEFLDGQKLERTFEQLKGDWFDTQGLEALASHTSDVVDPPMFNLNAYYLDANPNQPYLTLAHLNATIKRLSGTRLNELDQLSNHPSRINHGNLGWHAIDDIKHWLGPLFIEFAESTNLEAGAICAPLDTQRASGTAGYDGFLVLQINETSTLGAIHPHELQSYYRRLYYEEHKDRIRADISKNLLDAIEFEIFEDRL